MVIYENKVDVLIAGIQAKDVQDIVDKQTYIPTLGHVNNVSQVSNWLNKRITYLENAKTMTEQQIIVFVDNVYDGLTVSQQAQVDQIMLGDPVFSQTEEDWEETVLFRIYYFITT